MTLFIISIVSAFECLLVLVTISNLIKTSAVLTMLVSIGDSRRLISSLSCGRTIRLTRIVAEYGIASLAGECGKPPE
jgi:hypothetical protein